jgi:predicted pyridoxine 5'-phosphate oxidase superfamily flavin-nucleotide-binding protein
LAGKNRFRQHTVAGLYKINKNNDSIWSIYNGIAIDGPVRRCAIGAYRRSAAALAFVDKREQAMAVLTEAMKRIIAEQRLGFVATTNADGTPNLSPKATFRVLDDRTVAFAEIRSPNTVRNILRGSAVEVNFVDPFVRKGCRLAGTAAVAERGSPGYGALIHHFAGTGDLLPDIRAIVTIRVERVSMLISPAYDRGQTEDALRRAWTKLFRAQQPGGRFAED